MSAGNQSDLAGRSFSTFFDPRPARVFVNLGLTLFGLAGIGTLLVAKTIPLAPIICMVILLWHFQPVLRAKRPVLHINSQGLTIDGLGHMPWHSLASILYHERPLPRGGTGKKIASLEIIRAQGFLAPMEASFFRRFQARNWRKIDDAHLIILLSGLSDTPREIRAAFEVFLGRQIVGPRGLVV